MFNERGILDRLQEFASLRGADFYGFEPNQDAITLEQTEEPIHMRGWTVDGSVRFMPMREGEELHWRVAK